LITRGGRCWKPKMSWSSVYNAYFTEADFHIAVALVDRALGALSGLQRYLRSPRAKLNAQRARAGHVARNAGARTCEPPNPRTDEPTN
jgi:hypothetical protein